MAVSAGIELLEEGGLEALSARKIAGKIGYTVGTLYNVFEDFEDLVLHINADTFDRMVQQMQKKLQGKQDSRDWLLTLAYQYMDFAQRNPVRWNLLFGYARTKPLPVWFQEKIQDSFAIVETPLLDLLDGDTKEANCAAKVLWAGLHGICSLHLSQRLDSVRGASLKVLVENFITHYLDGLTKP